MNCQNHPLRQGVNTCRKCGVGLCDECGVERDGQIYCSNCLRGAYSEVRRGSRVPNMFLLVLFAGLPGANYMYMGLVKRGLFVLTAFFLSVYCTGLFNFFGFVTAGIVITSFFDGLRIRRKIIAGEPIADDVEDFKAFFMEYKLPIIAVASVLAAMEAVQYAARWVFGGRLVPALAVIALGIYFLTKKRKPKPPSDDAGN